MLRYTGHPLVDVGVATIVAWSKKHAPVEVTTSDLETMADYLFRNIYTSPDEEGSLTHGPYKKTLISLYPNAAFVQNLPADPQKRLDVLTNFAHEFLFAFRRTSGQPTTPCAFCGNPSVVSVDYMQVPLMSSSANFSPRGKRGLPACGACTLALHALPLGLWRVGKRFLFVASSNDDLLIHLIRQAVEQNRAVLTMGSAAFARTFVISRLIQAMQKGEISGETSLTAYVFMNSNQETYVSVDMHVLPSTTLSFVREAELPSQQHPHRLAAWTRAKRGAWERLEVDKEQNEDPANTHRNDLYESLFLLPEQAHRFFYKFVRPTGNWGLAELFLRKVMLMDSERLQLLYVLGERFAEYIRLKRSFYFDFGRDNRNSTWRRKLMKAADDYARQYGRLLITAPEFVQAFTAPAGAEYSDWRLARDIILLRIIELRFASGELQEDEEALLDDTDLDEEAPSS